MAVKLILVITNLTVTPVVQQVPKLTTSDHDIHNEYYADNQLNHYHNNLMQSWIGNLTNLNQP